MPIFHDILAGTGPPRKAHEPEEEAMTHREVAGGPQPDATNPERRSWTGGPHQKQENRPISRGELIQRIKRGESPSWTLQHHFRQQSSRPSSPKTSPRPSPGTPLLPSAEIDDAPRSPWHTTDTYQAGLEIERPKSALHSGDFRDQKQEPGERSPDTVGTLSTSPPAPWAFPSTALEPRRDESYPSGRLPISQRPQARGRAISQSSLSSNFVLLPPTSPLANASTNTDLDSSSRPLPRPVPGSPERSNRRHTFSPQTLQTYNDYSPPRFPTPSRAQPSLRRDGAFPYQAHQPRRSVSSVAQLLHSNSTPQTPRIGSRRPSMSSDTSPLHHAPMVGSYEESILRGRMSTIPSRPLDFVAQIGVLGKGKCKASLRCPPHVTIPFPAVFYSYGTGSGRITDNQPSPYVGLIDIENSLQPNKNDLELRPRSRRQRTRSPEFPEGRYTNHDRALSPNNSDNLIRQRKLENRKRQPQSPKQLRAPLGGSYRIPPVGQLQIIIKNPHKTAVKLFLVPYDLSDMEHGTKTFIRQRSYSAGAIIDMPVSARSNIGTDRPEASLSNSDDPKERPVLRYLVHLNACCLGKKGSERYYLYKSIRVVFANRVPDGKEKLRNEVQLPEPRYSAYKPTRELNSGVNNTTNSLAQDLANRRRSAAINPFDGAGLDAMDGISTTLFDPRREQMEDIAWQRISQPAASLPNYSLETSNPFAQSHAPALPFSLHRLEPVESRPTSRDLMDLDSTNGWPGSTTSGSNGERRPTSPTSPLGDWTRNGVDRSQKEAYVRNSNANLESKTGSDFEFVRSSSPFSSAGAAGLLSKRLRDFNGKDQKDAEF